MNTDGQHVAHSDRDLLMRYLAERKPCCPRCAAELTGLLAAMCPVCCMRLELCVQTNEPYLRAWATLTAALALSGGVGLFLLLGSIAWGSPFTSHQPFGIAAMIFHIVCIPLTVSVVLWRRRFVKATAKAQWSVTVIVAAAAVLAFVAIIASST